MAPLQKKWDICKRTLAWSLDEKVEDLNPNYTVFPRKMRVAGETREADVLVEDLCL